MRWPQCGQHSTMRVSAARMRRRTSGREGCGGGPVRERAAALFFSGLKAEILQEGKSQHAHQGVMVQTAPRAALEVIETKLFLDLLVHLRADPAPLEGCGQGRQRRLGRVVGEMIFALAGRPVLAD